MSYECKAEVAGLLGVELTISRPHSPRMTTTISNRIDVNPDDPYGFGTITKTNKIDEDDFM